MAECAFALFAGRDPITALNWSVYCDDGADVVAWNERYDVKATKWFGHYLIWPVNKRHIFESKKFDALQLVKCKPPEFEIAGWVPKCVFALEHRIAPAGHKLTAGTWYMRDNELWGCG